MSKENPNRLSVSLGLGTLPLIAAWAIGVATSHGIWSFCAFVFPPLAWVFAASWAIETFVN